MSQYGAYSDLQIGLTTAMTAVVSLTYTGAAANVPPPQVQFQEADEFANIANGQVKLLGRPVISWRWPNGCSQTARLALREFCTNGVSSTGYIQSPNRDGALTTYQAVMRWPQGAQGYQSFEYVGPFEIQFFRCVAQ